jgi:hypothetical protein
MSELQKEEGALEVVTQEVANLQTHAQNYFKAANTTADQFKGYAYLCGKSLLALKEVTGHGGFTGVKARLFPQKSLRALDLYMNFAAAVDFKNATVAFLNKGQLLLLEEKLSEKTEEKVFEAVNKATGDRGMMETIKLWKKKTREQNPKPRKQPTPEEQIEAENEAAEELAGIYLQAAKTILLDEQTVARWKPATKKEVLAVGIQLNDLIRKLSGKAK